MITIHVRAVPGDPSPHPVVAIAKLAAGVLVVAALPLLLACHASAACPYRPTDADGCRDAPENGVFLKRDLTEHARQGQQRTVLASHPMPFNVPAWDYPIGYAKDAVLRDPRHDRLPDGCVFMPRGAPFSGGPQVDCAAAPLAAGPLLIERWNFYQDKDCIRLRIEASVGRPVIIRDNAFRNGATCYVSNGAMVDIVNGTFPLEVSRNVFDGDHPGVRDTALAATTRGWHPIRDGRRDAGSGVGPTVLRYNVFVQNPGRALISFSNGPIDFSFNYVEDMGLAYAINNEHVEVDAVNNPKPGVLGAWRFINNLILEGSAGVSHAGAATFYISNGFDDGSVIDDVKIRNNVVIINVPAGGSAFTGAALFATGHNRYKLGVNAAKGFYAIAVTGNYVDPAGAYACALNSPYARDVEAVISGNTLSIAAIGSGLKVFPAGARLIGRQIKPAIIQAFEPSGDGGTGGAKIVGHIDTDSSGQGGVLTVTAVPLGLVGVGDPVTGQGVREGTVITSAEKPGGGPGRYRVNLSQTTANGTMILVGVGRYRIDGPPQSASAKDLQITPDVPTYWGSAATHDANYSLTDNSVIVGYPDLGEHGAQCAGHF